MNRESLVPLPLRNLLAPSFWGSIADRKGRRPSFLLCLSVLSLICVGLARVPTTDYWLLLLLRCLQAAGSASTIALGTYASPSVATRDMNSSSTSPASGVVADIIPRAERGGYMGITNLGFTVRFSYSFFSLPSSKEFSIFKLGPCVGPVFGGLLAQELGWR